MGFHKVTTTQHFKRNAPIRPTDVLVTFNRNGMLYFNIASMIRFPELYESQFAILHVDVDQRKIGIELTNEETDPHRLKVQLSGNHNATISGLRAFSALNWVAKGPVTLPVQRETHDGKQLLVISLPPEEHSNCG